MRGHRGLASHIAENPNMKTKHNYQSVNPFHGKILKSLKKLNDQPIELALLQVREPGVREQEAGSRRFNQRPRLATILRTRLSQLSANRNSASRKRHKVMKMKQTVIRAINSVTQTKWMQPALWTLAILTTVMLATGCTHPH